MRHVIWTALVACHSAPPVPAAPTVAAAAPGTTVTGDTPATTVEGAAFIVPAGWSVSVRGPSTILEPPEPGNKLALVDVHAADADAAVAAAWAAFDPAMSWPLRAAASYADHEGWSSARQYWYKVPPNYKRSVGAIAGHASGTWTVVLFDCDDAVIAKRSSEFGAVLGDLLPRGYTRETFAGRKPNPLDGDRLAELTDFIERSRSALRVAGIAVGIVQDGKVVLAQGFGEKELGKTTKPDADTLFMIGSDTKPLTTLLLAKVVDENKLTWDTPVTQVMPSFKLGDDATTRSVLVKHLVCACTGLPRQDLEWQYEFDHATPGTVMASLGTLQPTSKFGELFQYSNQLAAAGGYVAAYALAPTKELGAAYDAAMTERVFTPLGMTATTFDTARALQSNHAGAYGLDTEDQPAPALFALDGAMVPLRPAGGAWSNVRDLLKYVQMELARGALPGGKRYISEEALLARRIPQIAVSKTETYGMGLKIDTKWGVPVVHHGGDLVGYHSDVFWLPDHGVGAVILTNSDLGGSTARELFRRKLLEVLFDGKPYAEGVLASEKQWIENARALLRLEVAMPASEPEARKLAARYRSSALGDLEVKRADGVTIFDFGEWASQVGTRKNDDGTVSFIMISPGVVGQELVVGADQADHRTLILRDEQHEYTFVEVK